jgi:membrane-bound lytic murein transglycosylase MltF
MNTCFFAVAGTSGSLRSVALGFVVAGCLLVAACAGDSPSGGTSPADSGTSPANSSGAPANSSTASADSGVRPAGPSAAPAPSGSQPAATDLPDITGIKWTGDLDGMIERRLIRVLTTYSKIQYFVDEATPRGLVYDVFRKFEDDLNAKLKTKNLRVHVAFVPVAHDELIPALLEGRGDVVAAMTLLTDWRREQASATNPTRSNISSIIVTGPGVPPVQSLDDLAGRKAYLRLSDVSKQNLERFNARLAQDKKPAVVIEPAPEVLADEDILEMVNAGLVPMTMVDDYLAEFWQPVFPNIVLNRAAVVRSDQQSGMLVRKDNPQLLAELNAFIARNPEGSLTRNVLLQQYLKSRKWVLNATATGERAKFEQTVKLFQKYGDQYKLDVLLMAAQGYQESRLDQNAKSSVGAIGVMQVMPATGQDMKVGDIHAIENNVHAGVKYVRFMMDQYFENEPMDALNKGLFTFAAYNAGPGRIRDLRRRARERGLDPNKWFNNVEVVASETIGRETVQYVANIYKYYLAYKMLTENRTQRLNAIEQRRQTARP